MDSLLVPVIVGLIVVVIGIQNMRGNITSLHRYHRNRVREEDKIPYGKKVGLGSVIVGCAVIMRAVCQFAAGKMGMAALNTVGTVLLVIGLVVGLAIILRAMMKYNNGIF